MSKPCYIALDPDGTAHFVYEEDSFVLPATSNGKIIFFPKEMLINPEHGAAVFSKLKEKAEKKSL